MKKTQSTHRKRFPWLMASLGIAGLIGGYAMVIGRQNITLANGYSCPATKQICKNGDCGAMPSCAGKACSQHCPGNCAQQR